MKKGRFYAVGLGPGDSELVTLKAQRVLAACPVLAVPDSGSGRLALGIVRALTDISDKRLIDISVPMTRDAAALRAAHSLAARRIISVLESGLDAAMPNLGDVSVYASASYLVEEISAAGYETLMIPGVPSFCAAAARLNMSLTTADKPLCIIPGSAENLEELLKIDGTRVLMKSGKQLAGTVERLSALGLADSAAAVENCTLENERVFRDIRALSSGAGYFTTVIIKEAD